MSLHTGFRRILVFVAMAAVHLGAVESAPADQTARGVVFEDRDGDGKKKSSEPGIASVRVSNGRDIVQTDKDGRYELAVDDDDIIFVIKPRNYLSPLDKRNIPQFYYVHKPSGSPDGLQFAGVAPTGPLPDSIDFPMVHHPESDRFDVIVLGDPQSRDIKEIGYLAHDVVEELIDTKAAFAVALGDIAFDDLSVYDPYDQVMSVIDKPMINVLGNHDINFDVTSDALSDETWERVYGPPTYSFDWGPVHFIIVDNVYYDGDKQHRKYHCEFSPHMEFLKNDLALVPKDQPTVLLMHIPIVEAVDKDDLYALLADRTRTFSMSAHWHLQRHYFIGANDGWQGPGAHHHVVHATSCGAWWQGAPDEYGIPHGMMRDGAPNGYSIATFTNDKYSLRFKAARRPASHQMSIFLPDTITTAQAPATQVFANVFAGSNATKVSMRIDNSGQWRPMSLDTRPDPYFQAIKEAEASSTPPNGRPMPDLIDSPHLWSAMLPAGIAPGAHVLEVRAVDMFEQQSFGRRIFLVTE